MSIKVKLTDEDLSWITHYKINDSIYYVSNTDDTDTLIVKDIQIWNPKNTFHLIPRDIIG